MTGGALHDETAAYVSLRRTQNRYGDIVTRRAFGELPEVMEDGCVLSLSLGDRHVTVTGPASIGEFISAAVERFSFFEFVVLNTVADIDLAARRASSRLYIWELRVGRDDGRRTDAFGVYQDDLVMDTDGRWRFARRDYQSMSRTADAGAGIDQVVFDVELPAHGDPR